jgi:hypothetical protein
MFTGHYSVGFAAKPAAPFVPLWVFFVAAQWLDIFWGVFVLLGIEKLRIVPGITEANPYDLYYNPYSHSLPGALALSLLFGAIVAAFVSERRALAFAVLSLTAFSHWLLDVPVHIPDLPLYDDSAKVGLGPRRHLAISLPLELGLLAGGAWLYARAVPAKTMRGRIALWIFLAVLFVLQLWNNFGPPPTSVTELALMALASFLLLPVGATLVEWRRIHG